MTLLSPILLYKRGVLYGHVSMMISDFDLLIYMTTSCKHVRVI